MDSDSDRSIVDVMVICRMPEAGYNFHYSFSPSCCFEVCQKADYVGSTSYIINMIKEAEPNTKWAIGTENHLVERLKNDYPHLEIMPLSPFACECATMFRISPAHLMDSLVNFCCIY